jgi:hypothetical protein
MKRSLVCVALVTGSLVLASPTVAPAQHYCHGRSFGNLSHAQVCRSLELFAEAAISPRSRRSA